jgi:hypothetical protein
MNKYIYILAISTSLIFFSCKKDITPTTVNHNYGKVKSYTETMTTPTYSGTVTCSFTYDAQNRISSIDWTTTPAQKFVFTYKSNTEIDLDYFSSTFKFHTIYFLKNSQLDSVFTSTSVHDTTGEKYIYSSSNLLKTLNEYDYLNGRPGLSSSTNYFYDANGNMIRSESPYNKIETFEYYSDPVMPMPAIFPVVSPVNKSLKKKYTVMIDNSINDEETYTYTFDDKKRVSTMTTTVALTGTVIIDTFTYY